MSLKKFFDPEEQNRITKEKEREKDKLKRLKKRKRKQENVQFLSDNQKKNRKISTISTFNRPHSKPKPPTPLPHFLISPFPSEFLSSLDDSKNPISWKEYTKDIVFPFRDRHLSWGREKGKNNHNASLQVKG